MSDVEYCCKCEYLSLSEMAQNILKNTGIFKDHKCLLINKRIMHKDKHPRLPILEDCPLKNK